jgi:hypothetical protein
MPAASFFRRWFRFRLAVGSLLLAGLTFLVPPWLVAGPPRWSAAPQPTLRDSHLTLHARQALMEDPQLARLYLGVSVRLGVATVWGPVPSEDLARHAVDLLRRVQGLLDVRSQMYVGSAGETAAEVPRASPGRPALPPFLPLEPRSGGALMGRAGEAGTAKPPRRPGGGYDSLTGFDVGSARPLSEAVSLLPPVPPTDPSSQLPPAIEQLRQSNPRFQLVRIEAEGGAVHLHGKPVDREAMLALAESISRLPGVKRVFLHDAPGD